VILQDGAIMSEVRVRVRELMSRPSQYLRQVKEGRAILVTERGQPIGRIVPVGQPLEDRLEAMIQAGLILWSGNKLEPMPPVARAPGKRSVADLLVEDRE
jgi:prevent-host-death family protein